jgi:RNA polymerase sigma-70 factor (ECF subfamily)
MDADDERRAVADRARAAWPRLQLSAELFLEWLAARASTLEAAHAADLYLACACAAGDQVALSEFDRLHIEPLGVALARFKDRAMIDDVRQKLRLKLFTADGGPPKILAYLGKGPLKSWVRAAAVRLALTILRERRDHSDDDIERVPMAGDPELDFIKRRYRAPFEAAFQAALGQLPPRDQTLLRLYFVDGLSLAEIGRIQGVHEATISRRLATARRELLDQTRARLAATLNAGESEIDSLMQLVSSRFDASLPGLISKVV